MAQQTIGLGSSANDGTGDDLRTAGGKINDNFTELYTGQSELEASPEVTVSANAELAADKASLITGGDTYTIPASGVGSGKNKTAGNITVGGETIPAGKSFSFMDGAVNETWEETGLSGYNMHPGYVSGLWYRPPYGATTGVAVPDKLYAYFFPTTHAFSISGLKGKISTGAVGNMRAGLYANDPATGRPGALLVEIAAGVATGSTGDVDLPFASSQSVERGFWVASVFSVNPTMHTVSSATGSEWSVWMLGGSSSNQTLWQDSFPVGVVADHTYGALPATFPAMTAVTTSVIPLLIPVAA